MPAPDEELSADDIEASEVPHDFDKGETEPAEPHVKPDLQNPIPPDDDSDVRKVRVTQKDIKKYGSTPGCPSCARLEHGDTRTTVGHSDACRRRFDWHGKRAG